MALVFFKHYSLLRSIRSSASFLLIPQFSHQKQHYFNFQPRILLPVVGRGLNNDVGVGILAFDRSADSTRAQTAEAH